MNTFAELASSTALATCVILSVMPATASAAGQEPIVWKLESVSRVGEYSATVLGSPRVVHEGDETALCFDGTSDAIVLAGNPIAGWTRFTIEALIRPDATGAEEQRFIHIEDQRNSRLLLETRLTPESKWALDTFLFMSPEVRLTLLDREKVHSVDQWHWVALAFDGEMMAHYVNGRKELEGRIAFQPMTIGRMSIGVRLNNVSWYKGCIREIRFTPKALQERSLQQPTKSMSTSRTDVG